VEERRDTTEEKSEEEEERSRGGTRGGMKGRWRNGGIQHRKTGKEGKREQEGRKHTPQPGTPANYPEATFSNLRKSTPGIFGYPRGYLRCD
jgi:hypothetical protein